MFKNAVGRRLRIALEAPGAVQTKLDTTTITPELKKDAESNPLVRRAMELFDARVVRIEERPSTKPDTEPETKEGEAG